MSLWNPEAVDLSLDNGEPYQLTPALIGVDTLLTRDISRSSAMQRAGRAGREVCVSLAQQAKFLTPLTG